MAALNIHDLNNGKKDLDHIAEVATSNAPTTVDRLGNTKRTIAGLISSAASAVQATADGLLGSLVAKIEAAANTVLSSLGYAPPVDYVAGIKLTTRTQTVEYGGHVYAPKAAELPFTTSGTFEVAKFRLIEGVVGADLADSSGASLVGNGGETVAQSLDALQLPDYAALRAYRGPRKSVYVTGVLGSAAPSGIAGMIVLDPSDTTSPDNGGTCFVDALGRRWKRDANAVVNVTKFFLAGEVNHTGMFNRAMAAARRVYVPAGEYIVSDARFASDTEIFGDGDRTIIRVPADGMYAFRCDSGSPNVANNIKNLRMHNMQIVGDVDVHGFSEHRHLVSISGVSNVLFKHVLFRGFRGDGVYVGSSNTAGVERHNENVTIRRCRFDGVNRDNRNAISFIDIDGALVEGCTFNNCTRSTQPGPIDMEPNAVAYAIIKNVTVRRNKFSANGGGVGEVSVYVPAAVTASPQNITVEQNVSTGYVGTGQFFFFSDNRAPSNTSAEHDIKLLYNNVRNGNRPFFVGAGKRVQIAGNTFMDMTGDGRLGFTDTHASVRDAALVDNRFIRCGATSGNGMTIFKADYLTLMRNKFIDCGTGIAGASNAVNFNTGASSYVVFEENEFSSPTGKTAVAIQKEAGHTFAAATNRYVGNIDAGLTKAFQAEESDSIEHTYAPAITGSSSAGAGTYTTQYGRYRRIGKTVFFKLQLSVAAGHTGTGMVQISLPTFAAGSAETAITVALDGVSTTGGQIGRINPALMVNGAGAIRCYHTGTGTLAQTLIPAGAFTVYAAGSYVMQ